MVAINTVVLSTRGHSSHRVTISIASSSELLYTKSVRSSGVNSSLSSGSFTIGGISELLHFFSSLFILDDLRLVGIDLWCCAGRSSNLDACNFELFLFLTGVGLGLDGKLWTDDGEPLLDGEWLLDGECLRDDLEDFEDRDDVRELGQRLTAESASSKRLEYLFLCWWWLYLYLPLWVCNMGCLYTILYVSDYLRYSCSYRSSDKNVKQHSQNIDYKKRKGMV